MKERIRKTTTDLTYEEVEKALKNVEGLFKGGIEITNFENMATRLEAASKIEL